MKKIITLSLLSFVIFSGVSFASSNKYYSATAKCRDNTYSYAVNHRGVCSHHGGVSIWYR